MSDSDSVRSDAEAEMAEADQPDNSPNESDAAEDSSADRRQSTANQEDESNQYGCKHYLCRCAYVAPCCKKIYTCRLCHDEKETHEINRHDVMEIVCLECDTRQPVGRACVKCQIEFGRYFCAICRLFDDKDKKQFHCDQCGICRIGGRDNFFHCSKCDMCLSIALKDAHKCVEKVTHANCPVCLEDLHTSRERLAVVPCGHICHQKCYLGLQKSGNYACPICCHSMWDMTYFWQQMDNEIANTPMPDEYKDTMLWILCRDCHKACQTRFHVVGLKCINCGSYNTCHSEDPLAKSTIENKSGSDHPGSAANMNDLDQGAAAGDAARNDSSIAP